MGKPHEMLSAPKKVNWAEPDISNLPHYVQQALRNFHLEDLSWLDHPGDGGYPLDVNGCQFLQALVPLIPSQSILEFGSGISTVVLSRAVAALGSTSASIVSVEGMSRYRDITRNLLRTAGLQSVAEVHLCPVRLKWFQGRPLYSYHIPEGVLASHAPYDLVFVDGPPGYIGREATLYLVLPYLRPGGLVVMDDAARVGWEQRWLARWKNALDGSITIWLMPQFKMGLAILQVHNPAALLKSARYLLAEDLGHILRRLASNLKARMTRTDDSDDL